MHRIDTEGNEDGLFREGNPQIGQWGTIMGADWPNAVQEEICGVIGAAGIPLDKESNTQLLEAIAALIDNAKTAMIAATREKAGMIKPWGGSAAPAGYLECDGAVLVRAEHPDLFAAIGTAWNTGGETGAQFRLPDLRGEFLRGWDNGRGVDIGRALASAQGQAIQAHTHTIPAQSNANTGVGFVEDADNTGTPQAVATGSTGGAETRPRNVAVMFVIKD